MDTAALIAWVTTALAGGYLLVTWLVRGGMRQRKTGVTRFPALLIFGHFALAASGLLTWIAYLLTRVHDLSWASVICLMAIATLGCTMFARWGSEAPPAYPAPVPSAPATAEVVPHRYPAQGTAIAAAFGQRRGPARVPAADPGHKTASDANSGATGTKDPTRGEVPAESHFPIAVVAGHGAFAVSTLILVLLATLHIGT